MSADVNGRPYVKLSELKHGSKIELDGGFTCAGSVVKTVQADEKGELYFECREGYHFLVGQVDDGKYCIGVYKL